MGVFTGTFVAASTGLVLGTVGGVVSGAAAVVNFHVLAEAIALPATSFTPVVIVAVPAATNVRSDEGVNVAVVPPELKDTVPATAVLVLFTFTVNVLVLTVEL